MIFGFGTTESESARRIIGECEMAIVAAPDNIDEAIAGVRRGYSKAGDRYKVMDRENAPERYTYFFYNFVPIYKGRYLVEFTMHHINRRHPFSPDGWALMVTHWMLSVNADGIARVYAEAANA
jgi:hypothetical protein